MQGQSIFTDEFIRGDGPDLQAGSAGNIFAAAGLSSLLMGARARAALAAAAAIAVGLGKNRVRRKALMDGLCFLRAFCYGVGGEKCNGFPSHVPAPPASLTSILTDDSLDARQYLTQIRQRVVARFRQFYDEEATDEQKMMIDMTISSEVSL